MKGKPFARQGFGFWFPIGQYFQSTTGLMFAIMMKAHEDRLMGYLGKVENPDFVRQHAEEMTIQQHRAGAYALLASLLGHPPTANVLAQIGQFDAQSDAGSCDEFGLALASLELAAQTARVEDIEDEFYALFIGIGRGELMPYGSWYQTGFLMERPLSQLRDDLQALGYKRDESAPEPEDHAASLCEVMAIMINEQRSFKTQSRFFKTHLASWLERFFADLQASDSALFYKTVARFGTAFMTFEQQYVSFPE